MPKPSHGHLDLGVTRESHHLLDRETPLDPQRHGEMAQVVPAHRHLDLFLQLAEPVLRAGVLQDAALRRGEHQPQLAFRAAQFPAAQGVQHHRPGRDVAEPGPRFRLVHLVVGIGTLADVEEALVEIDVLSAQQFQRLGGVSHSGTVSAAHP